MGGRGRNTSIQFQRIFFVSCTITLYTFISKRWLRLLDLLVFTDYKKVPGNETRLDNWPWRSRSNHAD